MACMEVIMTASMPKAACRGARAITSTVEVQLALVTMPPVQPW